ncbi:MAG: LamG-like jellyroll fold domain-containing protein, partial [Verrucomicrobiota bacterium]
EVNTHGSNPLESDTDGDTIEDGAELAAGTDPSLADTDGDNLADNEEADFGVDPLVPDTDADGCNDGFEVLAGSDPAVGGDCDIDPDSRVAVDVRSLPVGPVDAVPNFGVLLGEFVPEDGDISVQAVEGINALVLDGSTFLRGPVPSEDLVGNSSRTIEAWVYNEELESEETVISWGRRGGPNGSNIAFNHGFHNNFGAIGHWGGTGPDIGWNPDFQVEDEDPGSLGQAEEGVWTYIAYTYNNDDTTTRVYTSGAIDPEAAEPSLFSNSEDVSIGEGNVPELNTWAESEGGDPLNILIGSQNDASGEPTGNLRGNMAIAKVTVTAGALNIGQLTSRYNADAPAFGREPLPTPGLIVDLDATELPLGAVSEWTNQGSLGG